MALLRTLGALARWLVPALTLGLGACHAVFDGEVSMVRCEVEGGYGPPTCPLAQTCVAGICAAVGTPLGGPCAADAECRPPGWCLDPSAWGTQGTPRCATTCCSSSDCGLPDEGLVCFAPPKVAGTFCWPAAELARGALGDEAGGAACAEADSCRSGVCDQSCRDVCCGDAACLGGSICRLEAQSAGGWSCGAGQPNGERKCTRDADCARGKCLPIEGLMGTSLCAEPCCDSRDCGSFELGPERYQLACAPGPEGVRACARALPQAAQGAVGAPCSKDEQCRSGICDPDEGYCSDLCCEDQSCGNLSQFRCRLGNVGGFSALRCIRN